MENEGVLEYAVVRDRYMDALKRAHYAMYQLDHLSTDASYTHKCRNLDGVLDSAESNLLYWYGTHNSKEFSKGLIAYEQYIKETEAYLVEVARTIA